LFIDPDLAAIDAAKDLGVPAIELHTGRYSHHWQVDDAALDELQRATEHAAGMGLAVHAGHGLTYRNVQPVARIEAIEELNIGHTIVSRAMFTGIGPAVAEMKRLLREARG
jgi:pyridoxine 5-phosphate synthase